METNITSAVENQLKTIDLLPYVKIPAIARLIRETSVETVKSLEHEIDCYLATDTTSENNLRIIAKHHLNYDHQVSLALYSLLPRRIKSIEIEEPNNFIIYIDDFDRIWVRTCSNINDFLTKAKYHPIHKYYSIITGGNIWYSVDNINYYAETLNRI